MSNTCKCKCSFMFKKKKGERMTVEEIEIIVTAKVEEALKEFEKSSRSFFKCGHE